MNDDLTPLQELAEAATQGPYVRDAWEGPFGDVSENVVARSWNVASCAGGDTDPLDGRAEQAKSDADYIAALDPKTVLALIARVRAAESKLDRDRMANILAEWLEDPLTEGRQYDLNDSRENEAYTHLIVELADAILSDESEARA